MKEKEKKILEFQYLQQQLKNLVSYQEFLEKYYQEILNSIESIKTCKETDEFLVDLGNNVFSKVKLLEKTFLVNIGSGIFLEKNPDETIKILEKRLKNVEEEIKEVGENIKILYQYLENLGNEIKKENK
jgi:prefoldin alpha subunit